MPVVGAVVGAQAAGPPSAASALLGYIGAAVVGVAFLAFIAVVVRYFAVNKRETTSSEFGMDDDSHQVHCFLNYDTRSPRETITCPQHHHKQAA